MKVTPDQVANQAPPPQAAKVLPMRNVAIPPPELPPLTRSVVACIAAILEIDPSDVPQPDASHPEPWTVWGNWLAQRGLGLVPVTDPVHFAWPGPWIALLESATLGPVATIAFGVPAGLVWKPIFGRETFADAVGGYIIAPHDPSLWIPRTAAWERRTGRVEALGTATAAAAPIELVRQVTARAGRGLEGDRYFAGVGTFSNPNARGTDITLVEAESFEQITLPTGKLEFEQARRNVITRGIDLNALVGERFFVGEVECLGQRLCEPCAHLERLTAPGVLRGFVHRGGLRADILTDGVITVGDEIRRA